MKLYVVQNSNGRYFRPVGYGGRGSGHQWQETLEKAKFYSKLGTAKSHCTFWYNLNPKLGCPVVLEFDLDPNKAIVIPMIEHATASIEKKKAKEAKQDADRKAWDALRNMDTAKKLISTLSAEQKKSLGL